MKLDIQRAYNNQDGVWGNACFVPENPAGSRSRAGARMGWVGRANGSVDRVGQESKR